MAIAAMTKLMIVSHRSEVAELLDALQQQGVCQILNAEEAIVSKDLPEPAAVGEKPRDIERLTVRLSKGIVFLKGYAQSASGLAAILAPKAVVDEQSYEKVVSDTQLLRLVDTAEEIDSAIEKCKGDIENLQNRLNELYPWQGLQTPVEELGRLSRAQCLPGLIPAQNLQRLEEKIETAGAAIQQVGSAGNKTACIVVCLNEAAEEVRKVLRSEEFEPVGFGGITGTIADAVKDIKDRLQQTTQQLQLRRRQAAELSKHLLELEILCDHYSNLLDREQTRISCPATEQTVLLEGWVKRNDFRLVEKTVSQFAASSLHKIKPAEGEDIPVEIENNRIIRPFEVITRLYGMPRHFEVDPTVFLAPFFAVFFGLCLTDAGYGLVLLVLMLLFVKKMQGDKRLLVMLGFCSVATVLAGALTGGWFGDAVQQFVPALEPVRRKLMWFDPLENPMMFFKLSLTLGYIQIQVGLLIAFVHNLKRKSFAAALFDQLTWLVMLNSIVLFIFRKDEVGRVFGLIALVPAALIFLFSQREGNWVGRLGMGLYNLFSAIFYMGDVLSYLRLMALGMVTAGLAMAVNVIAKITIAIPYGIGIVLTIVILVGGHSFNMALNALGAFVHTLRLQFAEFFPKFFEGGGRAFEPLAKQYRHIYLKKI